jgi:hypothetical protein
MNSIDPSYTANSIIIITPPPHAIASVSQQEHSNIEIAQALRNLADQLAPPET